MAVVVVCLRHRTMLPPFTYPQPTHIFSAGRRPGGVGLDAEPDQDPELLRLRLRPPRQQGRSVFVLLLYCWCVVRGGI